jgi:hypothetical protein
LTPAQAIEIGNNIIEPLLRGFGFNLEHTSADEGSGGSGGPAARSRFTCGKRSFEFHYRGSIGLVSYSVAGHSASHNDVAWALGCKSPAYPSYNRSAEEQFKALSLDISEVTRRFFEASESEAIELVKRANSRPGGIGRLSEGAV